MRVEFERRVLSLFNLLLDQPVSERPRWLRSETGGDGELREAVEALIAADSQSGSLPTVPPEPAASREVGPPPERLGNYRLVRELGRGGMGVVYLAERADGLFEQQVAIKLIRNRVSARASAAFEAERRMLARVEHPNVARLIDGGVAPDGRPWLATEYIAGDPIDHGVAHRPLAANVRLLLQAAQAVQFAHGRLIAHGDVKPANVIVGAGEWVKLLDFGVARLIGAENLELTGSFTPGFASPERLAGAPPSVADDVFALGRTLAAVTELSRDRELAAIIARATAPEARRYADTQALVADLEAWLRHQPVAARDGGRLYRARKFVRRHRLGVLAGSLAVIGLAGSAIIAETNYRRAERARAAEALRFADAHRTAHYLMFTLLDRLERQPGTLRLRMQISAVAQTYLDRLAASPGASREVRLDVARGYLRAAASAAMSNSANLVDTGRAQHDLEQADKMLARLRHDEPGWTEMAAPFAHAASLDCQNQLYAGHDARRALAEARRGLAEFKSIVPDPADRFVASWPVRICAGDALVWLDRTGEAVSLLEHDLAAARRRTPRDDYLIARNMRILGEAYYYSNRFEDAAHILEEAAAMQVRAHARAPNYGPSAIDTVNIADDLASTYGAMHRYEDQLRVARAALALCEEQAALDSDDMQSVRRVLSITRLVAGALGRLGRYDEGVALMLRTDARWVMFQRRFPDDSTTARLHLLALGVTADLQRRAGQRAAACVSSTEAAQGWAAFGKRWRLSPSDAQENVVPLQRDIAACTNDQARA